MSTLNTSRKHGPSEPPTGLLALFETSDEPTPSEDTPPTAEEPDPVRGLRPAVARLIHTRSRDMNDPERRPLLLLVVECPYCEHLHIHPGGHSGIPRLCLRNARCIGNPAGAYYFPAVDQ